MASEPQSSHRFDAAAWLAGFVALGGGWAVRDNNQIMLGFYERREPDERTLVNDMIDQLYADYERCEAVFGAIRAHRAAA